VFFPVIVYAVPETNPSGPATVFYPQFFQDDFPYWDGFGIDPYSIRVFEGVVPSGASGPIVGSPDEWVNGLDYAKWLAGAYVNPVPCQPLIFPVTWSHGRSWTERETDTAHYAVTWSHERSWTIAETDTAHYAVTWSHERSWTIAETDTAHYAVTWSHERSWSIVEKDTANYPVTWSHERSWSIVEKDTANYPVTWSHERSWSIVEKDTANYPVTWSHERQITVIETTRDNVIAFNCGTLVATGTTQGTAAAIAFDCVSVTATSTNNGVILPAGCYRIVVENDTAPGGATVNVYPPSGAKISGGTVNASFPVSVGGVVEFFEITATQWRQRTLS
jgi:hypothetical protein